MTDLVKYDAACKALAEAKAVDEVKSLHDQADAVRHYARQAKNKQLEVDAAEIRLRAERRLGEMLSQQPKATGGDAQRTRFGKGTESPPTLSDVGIDKKLSSRAQKLAAVPEAEFESHLGEWRERVSRQMLDKDPPPLHERELTEE